MARCSAHRLAMGLAGASRVGLVMTSVVVEESVAVWVGESVAGLGLGWGWAAALELARDAVVRAAQSRQPPMCS